jgi:hypothetical protein
MGPWRPPSRPSRPSPRPAASNRSCSTTQPHTSSHSTLTVQHKQPHCHTTPHHTAPHRTTRHHTATYLVCACVQRGVGQLGEHTTGSNNLKNGPPQTQARGEGGHGGPRGIGRDTVNCCSSHTKGTRAARRAGSAKRKTRTVPVTAGASNDVTTCSICSQAAARDSSGNFLMPARGDEGDSTRAKISYVSKHTHNHTRTHTRARARCCIRTNLVNSVNKLLKLQAAKALGFGHGEDEVYVCGGQPPVQQAAVPCQLCRFRTGGHTGRTQHGVAATLGARCTQGPPHRRRTRPTHLCELGRVHLTQTKGATKLAIPLRAQDGEGVDAGGAAGSDKP